MPARPRQALPTGLGLSGTDKRRPSSGYRLPPALPRQHGRDVRRVQGSPRPPRQPQHDDEASQAETVSDRTRRGGGRGVPTRQPGRQS